MSLSLDNSDTVTFGPVLSVIIMNYRFTDVMLISVVWTYA